jgi:hypothetical protein
VRLTLQAGARFTGRLLEGVTKFNTDFTMCGDLGHGKACLDLNSDRDPGVGTVPHAASIPFHSQGLTPLVPDAPQPAALTAASLLRCCLAGASRSAL